MAEGFCCRSFMSERPTEQQAEQAKIEEEAQQLSRALIRSQMLAEADVDVIPPAVVSKKRRKAEIHRIVVERMKALKLIVEVKDTSGPRPKIAFRCQLDAVCALMTRPCYVKTHFTGHENQRWWPQSLPKETKEEMKVVLAAAERALK